MKKISFLNKIYIVIIIILIIVFTFNRFSQKQDYKFTTFYQYQAIPDIQLTNTLHKTNSRLVGKVAGFVKFNNFEDQPKNVRQYYIISSTNNSQIFILEEIIKLQYLAPSSIGTINLSRTMGDDIYIGLEDEEGNIFVINKISGEVSMRDVAGDEITLITNQFDYKDYMKKVHNI